MERKKDTRRPRPLWSKHTPALTPESTFAALTTEQKAVPFKAPGPNYKPKPGTVEAMYCALQANVAAKQKQILFLSKRLDEIKRLVILTSRQNMAGIDPAPAQSAMVPKLKPARLEKQ